MSTSDLEVDIKHAESICFKGVRDFCFLDRITGAFPPETTKKLGKTYAATVSRHLTTGRIGL